MASDPWKDENVLKELYEERGMKQEEIGDRLGCSRRTIGRWLNNFNIETRSVADYDKPRDQEWHDKELLQKLYKDEKMSTHDIADEFGCTQRTIMVWLDRFDIQTRPASWEKPPAYYISTDGYEVWQHTHDDENYTVRVHRLIAVAEFGFDEVVGKDIHHVNGFKIDNRPENLTPMTRSEHGKIHHPEGEKIGE